MAPRVRRITGLIALLAVVTGAARAGAECDVSICAGDPCTIMNAHTIDHGCLLAFTGKTVTLHKNATLTSPDGGFTVNAKSFTVNGTLRAPGGEIDVNVDTDFTVATTGRIDTSSSNANESGTVDVVAGGLATIAGKIITDGVGYGGDLYIDAKSVTVTGTLQANGDGGGGFIWLYPDDDTTISGTVTANAVKNAGDGGEIDVTNVVGSLHVTKTGAVHADGVAGGSGGFLWLILWPSPGSVTMDGKMSADGPGTDGSGGTIVVSAGDTMGSAGDWSAVGGSGSNATGGDIEVDSGGAMTTMSTTSMKVGAGGGGHGGTVMAWADGDVVLAGKLDATANGAGSRGGGIWINGGVGKSVTVPGILDVTAAGGDGTIALAGCNVTVSGTLKANQNPDGSNAVTYDGTLKVSGKMLAGSAGGNDIDCPCSGVNVATATCASTTTCINPPTKTGTVTPAWRLRGIAISPCSCVDKAKDGSESDVDCGGPACPTCPDGNGCGGASDCTNKVCTNGKCQPASCGDGIQNGNESYVDCGGSCAACPNGRPCGLDTDCQSGLCVQKVCRPAHCFDHTTNADESDVDCGGTDCPPCADGKGCKGNDAYCQSHECDLNVCQPPTCSDRVQNGRETDVNCGGGTPCPKCGDGQRCDQDADCTSGVCDSHRCTPASCMDRAVNGNETDLNCGGGPPCPACPDGDICLVDSDCVDKVCDPVGNVLACQPPTCTDRAQNGDETDVNCGGSCGRCDDGKHCTGDPDCKSGVCDGGTCQAPTCSDRAKNGNETDFNCGGASACGSGPTGGGKFVYIDPRWWACIMAACDGCVDGQSCVKGSDCQSGVCPGGTCIPATCTDGVFNGNETDVDCGGGTCMGCGAGKRCLGGGDCESRLCDHHRCQPATCNDGIQNGDEGGTDCGGSCPRKCGGDSPCHQDADCASGGCFDGTCRCPDHDFTFTVQSSAGGLASGAAWPGGQSMQAIADGSGCDVTVNNPDGRVDLVCTLAAPFSIASFSGFSSCQGTGGDHGDGCGGVSCPIASYGSCCATRPSCSSALNGSASAEFTVTCSH